MTTAQRDTPAGATPDEPAADAGTDRWSRLPGFGVPTARFVFGWAVALLVANAGIIVTGGAVRLTGSGLGCPTWPQCTEDSFVPHAEMGIHGVIEFGNRMLTWVLVVIAFAATVAVWRRVGSRRRDRATVVVIALGIPFQAVIGGITVLTNLNPWVVSLHFVLSTALVSLATVLTFRTRPGANSLPSWSTHAQALRVMAWALYLATWVTIYLGTIVTGSGPHAGDENSPRNGLTPSTMTHLHANAVFAMIGLTVAVATACVVLRLAQRRAVMVFVGLLAAQGVLGVVQYRTDLPIALVLAHMLMSALVMISATWILLRFGPDRQPVAAA